MTETLKNIIPGQGVGSLRFGMSRDDVRKLLGKPDEKEVISEEGEDLSEAWHYDELDLSLSFEEVQYWELVTISVSSAHYQLEGNSLVGLERNKLLDLLKNLGLEPPESEGESTLDHVRHEILYAEEIEVDFWMEDDLVSEVQLGPFWSDEETIEWPE